MPGVCHWGPLIALSIITIVTFSSTYGALQLWSLPRSTVKYFRMTHFLLMYVWLLPIFVNFYRALKGPGYVPLGWKPDNPADEQYLQYCQVCRGFKPPRSHHCRQCKRCIMKMDHHCPWINSCVGHVNHATFVRFLFFVPFGCIHGVIVNANFLYRLINYEFVFHTPYLPINTYWILVTATGISLGAGTSVGVLILFLVQMRSILKNCTQVEEWILEKANHRRRVNDSLKPFVFPYNVGYRSNFSQVINWSGGAVGDGFDWPVKKGCGKYDFTIEQLEQKRIKKKQAITCGVTSDYNGSSCPIRFGLLTCLCMPRCGEGTIPVAKGDIVVVTRWQKRWVYGDKKLSQELQDEGKRVRGWFPRQCVPHPPLRDNSQPDKSSTKDNHGDDGQHSTKTKTTSARKRDIKK